MYLYGKNSVSERIKAKPESIKKILLQDNFKDERILAAIEAANITFKQVSEKELDRIKSADRLQGIVAEVERFEYIPFDNFLIKPKERNITLIFLDNLNDPHNLGSIMRITACFGGFAIVIPRHGSCEVNETVIHVASGGENFTPVSIVTNMPTALRKAKEAGYWIIGAVVEGGQDINAASLPFPACLVLGSEGKGIRHGVDKELDVKVTLPMAGADLSLNVAMASAIFCYELAKQRKSTNEKR